MHSHKRTVILIHIVDNFATDLANTALRRDIWIERRKAYMSELQAAFLSGDAVGVGGPVSPLCCELPRCILFTAEALLARELECTPLVSPPV